MVQLLPENPSFGTQIARGLGGGFSKGLDRSAEFSHEVLKHKLQQKSKEAEFGRQFEADQENYGKIKDAFGQKFADIWKASPTGARTELTRAALEARGRGIDLDRILGGESQNSSQGMGDGIVNENQQAAPQKVPPKQVFQELNNLVSTQDEGLLPSEKIARGKERYDTGLKQYQETGTKLRSFARDKERFDILESLDKGDKLPKDLGRANVDKEGNLRLPFLASPEAQRYVKTLNEFSTGAKDTFGSRVTNFDLSQFLKRYPTLMNTREGRRQLLQQMRIVNQINSIYYKSLKDVYDRAGGVRKIDADVAERFAEQLSEDKIADLVGKFNEIGQFSSRPAASEFKGKKIKDKETGEIFISDGEEWIPAE